MADSFLAVAAERSLDAHDAATTAAAATHTDDEASDEYPQLFYACEASEYRFATLCFFHCSGRLSLKRCDIDSNQAILKEAHEYVDKQIGGAPHSLLRASTMEPFHGRSKPVRDSLRKPIPFWPADAASHVCTAGRPGRDAHRRLARPFVPPLAAHRGQRRGADTAPELRVFVDRRALRADPSDRIQGASPLDRAAATWWPARLMDAASTSLRAAPRRPTCVTSGLANLRAGSGAARRLSAADPRGDLPDGVSDAAGRPWRQGVRRGGQALWRRGGGSRRGAPLARGTRAAGWRLGVMAAGAPATGRGEARHHPSARARPRPPAPTRARPRPPTRYTT